MSAFFGVHDNAALTYTSEMLALLLSALSVFGITEQTTPPKTPDIHFAVTPQPLADAMLTLAHVTRDDVVYDLGSGDGRIVVLAAQKYGARGVGVEIDRRLVEISRTVALESEVADRATFIEGDLFTTDISKATVVTLWLSTTVNRRLEAKLKRELRPGARIVSRQFPIGDWPPDRTIHVGDEVFCDRRSVCMILLTPHRLTQFPDNNTGQQSRQTDDHKRPAPAKKRS